MTGPKELAHKKPDTESQERERLSEVAEEEYPIAKRSRADTMKDDFGSFSDKELIERLGRDIVKVIVCYEALEGKFDIAVAENKELAESLDKAKRNLSSIGVALDKVEAEVKKGTAEADQKRKKLKEVREENQNLLHQLAILEKKKGVRREEILREMQAKPEEIEEMSSSGFKHGYSKGKEDKLAAVNQAFGF